MKRSRNQTDARMALKSALSASETYQLTSEQITQKIIDLGKRFNLPGYFWQWANGYHEAVRDRWQQYNLVFCRVWKGQIIPCKWDNLPDDLKQHIRAGKTTLEGHYWLNRDGTVGRPYFVTGEEA